MNNYLYFIIGSWCLSLLETVKVRMKEHAVYRLGKVCEEIDYQDNTFDELLKLERDMQVKRLESIVAAYNKNCARHIEQHSDGRAALNKEKDKLAALLGS